MKFQIRKAPLRTKFFFWTTLLTLSFCMACTYLYFSQMKKVVMLDALKQSEIILHEVEAIRQYARSVIRPKAFELTSDDDFILELMSTTYISLQIMEKFQEKMEGYTYRRVSPNPRNPLNRADKHEEEMADWFDEDRSRNFWQGEVKKNNGTFFVSMIPDFITPDCLLCHGRPEDAPPKLIERYGNYNGFRFKEGDLAGINSVSIPISEPMERLYTLTAATFLLTLAVSLCLLIALNFLFDKLVVTRLMKVFQSLGPKGEANAELDHAQADELDTLKESFKNLNSYVRSAQKGSRLMPNFIGPYVFRQPLAAGTLSWIYSGYHSETGEMVTLKIPFANIAENPFYRECYRNEIKILKSTSHPNILRVIDTIENILIAAPLTDHTPMGREIVRQHVDYGRFFRNLFDLISYLHTHGIVHHDIRPENFYHSPSSAPMLLDAGLAWWHKRSDDIFSAGLGPQGDPSFMAPEQLEGKRGDSRSDIYSLGVWLYGHFTGDLKFLETATETSDLLDMKHRFSMPEMKKRNLDPELIKILTLALHPNPEKRYQWVEDFRDDIIPHLQKVEKKIDQ